MTMANLKSQTAKLLKEDPPTASSSDEEEVETSSGEEEEQISDSKIPSQTLKSPSVISAAEKQDSGSDSGSETDSGSESEPEPPEKAIPVTVTTTALKSKKKEVNASPPVKSVRKRGNEGALTEVKAKRAKQVSGDEEEKKSGEENKKPSFQRLWSEEDEISLLQGMIDFKAETGSSPFDDMNGFYDKVKKCISFDASKSQFSDKIRGLKKNYIGGRKKSLESCHDKKCLGLVKFIWGCDGMGPESSSLKSNKKVEKKKEVKGSDVVVKSNVKGKNVEEDEEVVILGGDKESSSWFEKSYLVRSIGGLGVDEYSVKEKWSKVSMETKKRMEDKFKVVDAMEYEMLVLKADLLKEVSSVISEV